MSLTALAPEQIAKRLYRSTQQHVALGSPAEITDDHVQTYRRTGFLAVQNVFTPKETTDFADGLIHLITGGNPEFKGLEFEKSMPKGLALAAAERETYVRKLAWFTKFDPRLTHMADHPVLHAIMRRLIGEEARLIQDMALLKPPHVGREKPWHQDSAYFEWSPPTGIIGTWTALDPATPENGCMHVIPGSHLAGPQPHYHDRDCQLADEDVQVEEDVVVPLAPGGVLFFSALLHHGTPPNRSPNRRRAIQLHYAGKSCREISHDEHAAMFKDTHGAAGCRANMRPIVSRPENL